MLSRETLRKFEKYVEINYEGCWEWLGPVNWNGYGRLWTKRCSLKAHRISWFRN